MTPMGWVTPEYRVAKEDPVCPLPSALPRAGITPPQLGLLQLTPGAMYWLEVQMQRWLALQAGTISPEA